MPQTFYSNGKLLITGEYLVLDGAKALAIPTKYGQSLCIEPNDNEVLKWKSFDADGNLWFEGKFSINDTFKQLSATDISIAERLTDILKATKKQKASFISQKTGVTIKTHLDFPRNWGLGTSSTLINNIAQWTNIDPYKLLENTFGGSGYDIACAKHNLPITYQLQENGRTIIEQPFGPKFKEQLYFVFLNKKQNSREGIAAYKKNRGNLNQAISEIDAITDNLINCTELKEFQLLMETHETIIAEIIKQPPVKNLLFKDFNGSIKSLGAWGGDFILVACQENPESYFKSKGFNTIIPYHKMTL